MSNIKRIKILDESLAKKIAAGEVVERPSSVVKELVENALDAGSTFITVEIKQGGKKLIRVSDNGHGIDAEDMRLAFYRHATSKIESNEDLFNISMMGFRGEALYSISAVSNVTLVSKPPHTEHGYSIRVAGGVIEESNEAGCPNGCSVTVEDLFFNTPARLKFMKSDAAETAQVGNIIQRFILSHPQVSFKFISNNKLIYQSSGDGSLANAIYCVYGKDIAQNVISFEGDGAIKVTGCVGNRQTFRSNRNSQSLFINHRYIKDYTLSAIIENAYGTLLMKRSYPFFVLNIAIEPGLVDVNVHPQKLVVRFSDINAVKSAVHAAIAPVIDELSGHAVALQLSEPVESIRVEPKRELHSFEKRPSMLSRKREPRPVSDSKPASDKPSLQPQTASEKPVFPDQSVHHYDYKKVLKTQKPAATLRQKPGALAAHPAENKLDVSASFLDDEEKAMVIGQAFDSIVIVERGNTLYLIDQHAAHERLLYERMIQAMAQKQKMSQQLLIPQMIDVAYDEKLIIEENIDSFTELGFVIEDYGRLSYQIRAVPFILGQPQVKGFFREALDTLMKRELDSQDTDAIRQRIITAACKRAVKAGDKLTAKEVDTLLSMIESEKVPLTCPHGRPFIMTLSRRELDKRFGRTQ